METQLNYHIYSLVKEASNVIIRNLGISKVLADNGDAIGIREFSSSHRLSKRRAANVF